MSNECFIKIGKSETNSKTITLYKHYPEDTILIFNHKYKDTFDYKFEDNLLTITRTDENTGWGQDLIAYLSFSSNDKLISENKFSIFVIACDSYHYLTDVTFHFLNENINNHSKFNVYYINETLETRMPNVTNLMTGKIIINGKDSFVSRLLKGIKQIKSDYVYLLQDDHWYYKEFLDEVTINTIIEICYKYNLDQLKLTPGSYGTYKCKNYFNNDFEIDKVFSNECLYMNNEFSIHWAFGSNYPMSHNPTIFKKQYLIDNLEECLMNNVHTPWQHEIYNFKYRPHIKKQTNDTHNLRIACISKRYENQKKFGIVRHGKITDFGFKIINENRHLDEINLCNINYLLKDLGPIEKKIHISWKKKNILDLDFNIIKHGIKQLKELNPEYIFEISDNDDVEKFIKKHISNNDYDLIKDRNIVEKVDLWRLLKIYHEGGFYMDIDRLYNIPLKDIIKSEHKCILPMHGDIDFSQDIMISSSKNIFFKEAIDLNLKRRKEGCKDILTLGPITYFHAITKILLGQQIPRSPSKDNLTKLRSIISNCKYLSTFRENPPYTTLVYNGSHLSFDKKEFYKFCDVTHWTKKKTFNNKSSVDLPMFYINLDKRILRRESMEREKKKHNLNIIRFSGIDGMAMERKNKFISKGHYGCWSSAYKLWEKVRDSEKTSIIFQDDIVFCGNFSNKLNNILKEAIILDYDIILLAHNWYDKQQKIPVTDSISKIGLFHGLQAYIITPKCAKYLCKRFQDSTKWKKPDDVTIGQLSVSKELKVFTSTTNLVILHNLARMSDTNIGYN